MQRLRHSLRKLFGRSPLDPHSAYQLWASTYDDAKDNALLFAEEQAMMPLLRGISLTGKQVLDAGCGTGRYLRELQEAHPNTIAAVDFSDKMLERAKQKVSGAVPVSFHHTTLEHLPFPDSSFDVILCTLVLGHVRDLGGAIGELARVLRPGGEILLSDFHPFGQLLGWERTFRTSSTDGGKIYSVQYYGHLHSTYFTAFQKHHLDIVSMREPILDESLLPYYRKARREDIFEQYKGYPILLIIHVRKK
jgi:malonyl-CoA O-methyltransferase